MKAIWDWHYPRKSEQDERDLVSCAADLRFDTIVIGKPSSTMASAARRLGIKLVAVISPYADPAFAEIHPECLQQMLPFEETLAANLHTTIGGSAGAERLAHRWYPYLQNGKLLCYDQDASLDYIKERVDEALKYADGVALDGFGYKNHYACFCEHCLKRYGNTNPESVAKGALETLITSSKAIYEHVKTKAPNSIVMNHVWPPFEPDPFYGAMLYLDYCTQTISWFFRPHHTLEHVTFEASEHQRLQIPGRNRFVPFIGFFNEPYQRREPDRVAAELEIGLTYGDGNIVFSTLEGPMEDEGIARVIRERLK